MTPQECIRTYEALKAERAGKDEVIDLIGRFVIPGKGNLYTSSDENAVDWKHRELYDETAVLAAQTLAASIHGAMTNPANRWFQFSFRQHELNSNVEAAAWISDARDLIYNDLMDSNWNTEINETYLSDVCFGDAILGHSIDQNGADTFLNHDVKGTYYAYDYRGELIGLYVVRDVTLEAIYREYEYLPKDLYDVVANEPYKAAVEKREVLQAIYFEPKNKGADTSKLLSAAQRPYQEKFILVDGPDGPEQLNTDESGYYEFPAYVLRWGRVAGSKFSYSPAIMCLGTILSLNQLVELILANSEKAVDPPLLTLDRGVIGNVDMRAGGQTSVRSLDAIKEFVTGARFDVSQLERQQLVTAIRQAFFVDQLELKQSPAMTATEVTARVEHMQRLMGPALTRVKSDLLDKMLQRKFFAAVRGGRLPEPPQIVLDAGATFDIEYVGPWSRAQKSDSIAAMEQSLMYVAQLAANTNNEALLDNFDTDAIVREISLERGMAPRFIRDEGERQAIRQQRAEAQQAQAQAQMQLQQAQANQANANAGKAESEQQQ